MKRTLSLLLAVIMVVSLLPAPMAVAANVSSDDIYIDDSSDFVEFEEPLDPEVNIADPEDPMPDLPDEEPIQEDEITLEQTQPGSQDWETPSKDSEFPVALPDSYEQYPDERTESENGPALPEAVPDVSADVSVLPELCPDIPEKDTDSADGNISSSDPDEPSYSASGNLSGKVDSNILQSYAGVNLLTDLTWYANATGTGVDTNGYAIDTEAQMPRFETAGNYKITIMPDPTAASAADATQLHISLYQLYVGNADTAVEITLDETAFRAYPNITEVVIHVADSDKTLAVDPVQVRKGSLTMKGLETCRLVLDGKSMTGNKQLISTSDDQLIRISSGSGAKSVKVSYVSFRNAPRSAVRVLGGYIDTLEFTNCIFENTCTNLYNGSNDGGAIDIWPYLPESSTRNYTSVGSLNIDSCRFEENQAWRYGGAVNLFAVFGKVEIRNSLFSNNKNITTADTRYGGALSCKGFFNELELTGNTFANCQSVNGNGGAIGIGATVGMLTISGTFQGCSASTGGAIYIATEAIDVTHFEPTSNLTGKIYSRINTLQITDSSFTDCRTVTSAGGVLIGAQVNQVIVDGNTFENCISGNKSGGGGLRLSSAALSSNPQWAPSQWTATGLTIETYAGGEPYDYYGTRGSAKYTAFQNVAVKNTTFTGCIACYGGGLYVANDSSMKILELENVTVTECVAAAYIEEDESTTGGNGGGMGLASFEPGVDIRLTNVTVFHNRADSYGGGVYVNARGNTTVNIYYGKYDDNTASSGGGMFITGDTDPNFGLIVTGAEICNNITKRRGGGIYVSCRSAGNSFTDVQIYGNIAGARKDSSGNIVEAGTAEYYGNGGGLYFVGDENTAVTFSGGFVGAKREGTDVVAAPNKCFEYAKEVIVAPETDGQPAVTELQHQSGGQGGGIVIVAASNIGPRLVMSDTKVLYNEAMYTGGGIDSRNGTNVTLNNVELSYNTAPRGGGAFIYNLVGSAENEETYGLYMSGGTVSNNRAYYDKPYNGFGGGLLIHTTKAKMDGVMVSDNKCATLVNGQDVFEGYEMGIQYGGGIAVLYSSSLELNGGSILRNEASNCGGIAIFAGSTVTMQNVLVSENKAWQFGGGVYVLPKDGDKINALNAIGCTFSDNEAGISAKNGADGSGGNGGAIAASVEGTVNLTDCKIENNKAYVGYEYTFHADGSRNYVLAANNEENPNCYKVTKDENGNILTSVDKNGNPTYKERYGYGGGVYCYGATANFYGTDVSSNEAGRRGGGVYGERVSTISIYNLPAAEAESYLNEIDADQPKSAFIRSKVRGNVARDYAGGIGSVGNVDGGIKSNLYLDGTLVDSNTVLRHGGGGVYISSLAECTIINGTVIQNNTAEEYAGGIYANIRANTIVENAEVINNTSKGAGGGFMISADSTVKITGGRISDNHALGINASGYGGGIYATGTGRHGGSQVIIEGGEISNNTAADNGGGIYGGGFSDDDPTSCTTVSISGGTISGNQALGIGTRVSTPGYGGGVLASVASTITITGGSIANNHAVNYGGGVACNMKATIYVNGTIAGDAIEGKIEGNTAGSGGGIYLGSTAKIYVSGGAVINNTAQATWNAAGTEVMHGNGGAICAIAEAEIVVTGGEITNNHAIGMAYYTDGTDKSQHYAQPTGKYTTEEYQGGNGGAIYAQAKAKVTIQQPEGSTVGGKIARNDATKNGGGIYATGYYNNAKDYGHSVVTVDGGEISENTAGNHGGGIYATGAKTKGADSSGAVILSGGTIFNNEAGENGGGIYAYMSSSVTVTGGSIAENEAKNGAGVYTLSSASVTLNGGSVSANNATDNGGGIYATNTSTVLIKGGEITSNTCTGDGAGIHTNGTATVSMQGSDDGQTFGSITYNTGAYQGGGIYAGSGSKVTLEKGSIRYNTAKYGGGIFASGDQSKASTVSVQGGDISYNTAMHGSGGGMYVVCGSNVTVSNGSINDNQARHTDDLGVKVEDVGHGGGIYVSSFLAGSDFYGAGHVTVSGGNIYRNTAQGNGGAIYATSCSEANEDYAPTIIVSGGNIYENTASLGGAVYATWCSDVNIDEGDIYSNTAKSGGGIYASTNSDVQFTGGEIYLNTANDDDGGVGGGIYATHDSAVTLNGGTVRNNLATGSGGGLYLYNATMVKIQSGFVRDNTANETGGGIGVYQSVENEQPQLIIEGGTISGNKALGEGTVKGHGGGIRAYAVEASLGGKITIKDGVISVNEAIGGNGGGLCIGSSTELVISGGTISANTAKRDGTETGYGGGVYMGGSSQTSISGGIISENISGNGGGFYSAASAQCTLTGGSITLNCATANGGALYATGTSKLTVSGGSMDHNYAVNGSGVYAVGQSEITIQGGTIFENGNTDTSDQIVNASDGGGIYAAGSAKVSMEPKPGDADAIGSIISNRAMKNGGGLYITEGAQVELLRGKIQSNTADCGGGLYAGGSNGKHSTVKIDGGEISLNVASHGGGIYVISGADVNVSRGKINQNTAKGSGGNGGGVYASGSSNNGGGILNITGGEISENTAGNNGGGIYATSPSSTDVTNAPLITVNGGKIQENAAANAGGGVYATYCAVLKLKNGEICQNTAKNGGGMYANNGANIEVTGGEIWGNEVTSYGGGTYIGSRTVAVITGGKIRNNVSQDDGGGIYATGTGNTEEHEQDASSITVNGGEIYLNTAADFGGGIYSTYCADVRVQNGKIYSNTAGKGGGIAAMYNSDAWITGGEIYSNNATAGTGGGGLFTLGSSAVDISGGKLYGNTAQNGAGIYMSGSGTVTITAGELNENIAAKQGGAIFMYAASSTSFPVLTVSGGVISHNQAQGGNGGGIYSTAESSTYGGRITVDEGMICDNECTINGGGIAVNYASQCSINGGTVTRNSSGENGGGISVTGGAMATVTGGEISDNIAENGGGIYLSTTTAAKSALTVSGGAITGNQTDGAGGGIFSTASKAGYGNTVTVNNGVISNNQAMDGNGGGIALSQSSVCTVNGGTISGNAATRTGTENGYGGGIYQSVYSQMTVNGGTVSRNRSYRGGGIYVVGNAGVKCTVNGGTITQNTSSNHGGGILCTGLGETVVQGGEISQNTAVGDGGGIYVFSSTGTATVQILKDLEHNTVGVVKDNSADNGGGVCVYRGGKLIVNEGQIINNQAIAPKNASLPKTGWGYNDNQHGAGGGICLMGTNDEGLNAVFQLTGTADSVTGKMNVAIYGNTATFSGDEVFSNGKHTLLEVPLVSQMQLDGYELDIVGWFEDYNTGDNRYHKGLNSLNITAGTNDLCDGSAVKRYRNSTASERQLIADRYVNGSGLAQGVQYVNLENAYVAMALGIPAAFNDTVVVDFDLSVDIDLLSNDMLLKSENIDVNPVTDSKLGLCLPADVAADKEILYSPIKDGDGQIIDTGFKRYLNENANSDISILNQGTATWKKIGNNETGILTYKMNASKMDKAEVFYYVVPGERFYYYASVTVVPASTLYYEDNSDLITYYGSGDSTANERFADWEPVLAEGQSGNMSQDQDRPGMSSILEGLDANNVYGYDSNYASTTTYSGGSAYKVTVSRDKNNVNKTTNARASFTFTGTGFDIVSLCNASTGIVMINVYEGAGIDFNHPDSNRYVATYMVDTYYGYRYDEETDKWVVDPSCKTSLYQVPVIKADLTKVLMVPDDPSTSKDESEYKNYGYGTYSVEIYIAPSFLPREVGYWEADFYLDAIRIYNPAGYNGGDNTVIRDAYMDDKEGWPTYQELRNLFIEQTELSDDEQVAGIIFIDGNDNPTIKQYKTWGPNNEIYLGSGQSIAFALDTDGYSDLVASVQIGMRGVSGTGNVSVQYQGSTDVSATTILNTVLGTTDMYYDISAAMGKVLTVTNNGQTPISLSNIKVTHIDDPSLNASGSGQFSSMFGMTRADALLALEILTPEKLADPIITPKRPALSFNGMVCYNVFFSAEELGDLTAADLGLAVFDSYDADGTVETAKDVIMGATEIDGLYMVATNGIHAKYLGDIQYFRAFAKRADGTYVYSKMVSYSAVQYAKNALAKSDDVKLKQLVVAMLNYGAEAQKFFGYKTDDLMNKDLTADDQALLSGFHAASLNKVGTVDASKVGAFASTGGFTKKSPAISFKGAFEINYFFTPANEVDGDMKLYFWNEQTYRKAAELTAENADKVISMTLDNGVYTASSDEIAAKYLDKTLYVAAVYESDGVVYCSGVLPYSIAAYCQKPPAGVQDLATAAAIYGAAAKQYFDA